MATIPARRTRPGEARPAAGRALVALAAILTLVAVGLISLFAVPASASPLATTQNAAALQHRLELAAPAADPKPTSGLNRQARRQAERDARRHYLLRPSRPASYRCCLIPRHTPGEDRRPA